MAEVSCVIRPYEGITLLGLGEVDFGATPAEVEALLGPPQARGRGRGRLYYQDYAVDSDRGLAVRFDFDGTDRCEAIEFLWPRAFPPRLSRHVLEGPTLRQAAELLAGLGYAPWDDDGPIAGLAMKPSSDTVYFHDLGLSLWTEMGTETNEHGELGEYVLDTVFIWRRGYWGAPSGSSLRIALPGESR